MERIAAEIIHDQHSHLGPVRVVYVFASEAIKRKGKELWGRAKLVTGLNAYLAGVDADETEPFFVIEISAPIWRILTDPQKRALVDHELEHLDVDPETSKLILRGHDLEEFSGVVRRHGLWRDDVIAFVEAAKAGAQKGLFDKDKAETVGA